MPSASVAAPSSTPGRMWEWRSIIRRARRTSLRGLDVQDLVLERSARRGDLDDLALLAAHDRLADRRLVRELVRRGIGLGRADDAVLDGLVRVHVLQADLRADGDLAGLDLLLRDDARGLQPLLENRDPGLEMGLLVLRVVVLRVLGDIPELACDADPLRDFAALVVREVVDLLLALLVALGGEDGFLHRGR